MTDRSEISARLRPEKIDHPIECPADDDTETVDFLKMTRAYTLEKFKSWSKVNPKASTWGLAFVGSYWNRRHEG